MDAATYDRYEQCGTNLDRTCNPIRPRPPKHLLHLAAEEGAMYEHVLSPDLRTHRRIEQERIELSEAARTLNDI